MLLMHSEVKRPQHKSMTCCISIQEFLYRQSYSEIFVWWFRYDLFQMTKGIKVVQNDEIKIIIADHTHAWAEIRATYDWYSRTKWIFVEYKTKKNVWSSTNSSIQKVLSLCFSSRDQILASPKKPLLRLHRGEISDSVVPSNFMWFMKKIKSESMIKLTCVKFFLIFFDRVWSIANLIIQCEMHYLMHFNDLNFFFVIDLIKIILFNRMNVFLVRLAVG